MILIENKYLDKLMYNDLIDKFASKNTRRRVFILFYFFM
jgi:hypothetical protein